MTRKEKNREIIIQKSLELFAHDDYHAVQMDEIAEAAKVSKGTLYNHFSSKKDLYVSAIEAKLKELGQALGEKYENRNPWKGLTDFVSHYEDYMHNHPHFFRILRKSDKLFYDSKNSHLTVIRKAPCRILEKLIITGSANGHFKRVKAEDCADLIIGMMDARLWTDLNNGRTKYTSKLIVDFLRTGLAAPDGKEPK